MTKLDVEPGRSDSARIRHLDGWRGVSILLVLAGHFIEGNVHIAVLGVYLFFALSGRLMAEVLFVDEMAVGPFYRRRFARIYPALLAFVVAVAVAFRGTHLALDWPGLFTALTFTLNYRLAAWHPAFPIENLWSLCVEEHAYLVLGAAALLIRARRLDPVKVLLAIAALSLLDGWFCHFLLHQDGRTIYWRSDCQLAPIFLAAAAHLAFRRAAVPPWVPLLALCGALAALFLPTPLWYAVLPSLLAVAIATLDKASAFVRHALSWRPLTALGIASYSIYLWQHPFYRLSLDHAAPWWLLLAGGLASGSVGFQLIEQPTRRWLYRTWAGRSRAGAPTAARLGAAHA